VNFNHEKEIGNYIDSEDPVNFMLTNGMKLTGVVNWQDDRFINIEGAVEGAERSCTISKHSVLCYFKHFTEDDKYATIEDI